MKPRFSNQRNHALTIAEVLVILAVVCVLASLAYLTFHRPKVMRRTLHQSSASEIQCINNLKQISIASRIWAGDNNDKYPMQVSVTNGGSMELAADGNNVCLNYLVMSNELIRPQILWCPADVGRTHATNFTTDFNNNKISYFVGLDADQTNPQMFLSGDDNFAIGGVPVKSGLLELSSNTPIAWSAARHKFAGNIVLADGSVQQLTQNGLQQALHQTSLATDRLAIP